MRGPRGATPVSFLPMLAGRFPLVKQAIWFSSRDQPDTRLKEKVRKPRLFLLSILRGGKLDKTQKPGNLAGKVL
jgi:hypothetical protein